jgi:hypothetical protein
MLPLSLHMKFIRFAFSLLLFPALLSAQEIKTKVTESQFDIKPDAVKEEQFDEATTFAFAGLGWARRTGPVMAGFTSFRTNNRDLLEEYTTTTDDVPHRNGIAFNLGFRHFFKNGFGLGLSGHMFRNSADFYEDDFINDPRYKSSSVTLIFDMAVEGLYRHYLTSSKTAFAYAGLGLGMASMIQDQTYRSDRETQVSTNFFLARPMAGINFPIVDLFHGYAEAGYAYSAGSISYGDLSLSRFSISAGIQIRLNSF